MIDPEAHKNSNGEQAILSGQTDVGLSREMALDQAEFGVTSSGLLRKAKENLAGQHSGTSREESPDSFASYCQMAKKYGLLNAEQEVQLAHAMLRGDRRARETLINHNLRLVISIAKNYARGAVALPDLIQEGNIGLIRATDKFDPQLGFRFSTYATHWIRKEILNFVRDKLDPIRKPTHISDEIRKVRRIEDWLRSQLGCEPNDEDLAIECEISLDRLRRLREYSLAAASLDQRVGDEDSLELGDFIQDPNGLDPIDRIVQASELEKVLGEVSIKLSRRERDLMRMRFGLDNSQPLSLEECSVSLGISRERARQIELAVTKKLRRQAAALGYYQR